MHFSLATVALVFAAMLGTTFATPNPNPNPAPEPERKSFLPFFQFINFPLAFN